MSGKQPETVPPPPPFKPARPPTSAQVVGKLFAADATLLDDVTWTENACSISKASASQVAGPGGYPPPPPPHSPPPPKPKNGKLHGRALTHDKEMSLLTSWAVHSTPIVPTLITNFMAQLIDSWAYGSRIYPTKEVHPGGNPPAPPRPCPDPIPPPPRPPRVELIRALAIFNAVDTLAVKAAKLARKAQHHGARCDTVIRV
ncbi:unnamed protein product [Rhizoctonia solani]|uniref:Uncharacterized protein n=1 Tax=Rhizoctonia solani TaxID=456999 RepID=A0A8H3C222_9AGAM|nr:unnamed protein product [Rhizoctonia solani]